MTDAAPQETVILRKYDMASESRKHAPIHAQQTVSEAISTVLKHNFDHLSSWEEIARSWEDIEGVHRTRVLFRRMRSALTGFRSAIPRAVTKGWSDELRWLADQLGQARDLDVFIDEGLGAIAGKLPLPGEQNMMALAQRHREQAYETVRSMLDSERYARFRQDFGAWVDEEGWLKADLSKKKRKRLKSNLIPFARKLLDKQERQVLEAGTNVNPDSAAEMHRLRIECKKLRYATEFFIPLFSGMDTYIGHMKGLQDLLGVMNDVAVMRDLVELLLAGEHNTEVHRYAGGLVGWRTRQYVEIRGSFDGRWDELVHAKHPWWKKSAIIR